MKAELRPADETFGIRKECRGQLISKTKRSGDAGQSDVDC